MITFFDRPEKTSKNGKNYFKSLRTQYEGVMNEILFILRNTQGLSAEYIENKPVPVRKRLVKDILDELEKTRDGSGAISKT